MSCCRFFTSAGGTALKFANVNKHVGALEVFLPSLSSSADCGSGFSSPQSRRTKRRRTGLVVLATKDHYGILGVARNSSRADIKKAYRNLARKFHPDVNKSADAEQSFLVIKRAYEVLSDDHSRSVYDRWLLCRDPPRRTRREPRPNGTAATKSQGGSPGVGSVAQGRVWAEMYHDYFDEQRYQRVRSSKWGSPSDSESDSEVSGIGITEERSRRSHRKKPAAASSSPRAARGGGGRAHAAWDCVHNENDTWHGHRSDSWTQSGGWGCMGKGCRLWPWLQGGHDGGGSEWGLSWHGGRLWENVGENDLTVIWLVAVLWWACGPAMALLGLTVPVIVARGVAVGYKFAALAAWWMGGRLGLVVAVGTMVVVRLWGNQWHETAAVLATACWFGSYVSTLSASVPPPVLLLLALKFLELRAVMAQREILH